MTQDQGIGVVWAIGGIVLVGSSLVARGLPPGRMMRMAAIWVVIFTLGLLIVSLRGRVRLPRQMVRVHAMPPSNHAELT